MRTELIKLIEDEFDRLVSHYSGRERDAFFELICDYSGKLRDAGFADTGFSQVTEDYKICALLMKLGASLKYIENGYRHASDI